MRIWANLSLWDIVVDNFAAGTVAVDRGLVVDNFAGGTVDTVASGLDYNQVEPLADHWVLLRTGIL